MMIERRHMFTGKKDVECDRWNCAKSTRDINNCTRQGLWLILAKMHCKPPFGRCCFRPSASIRRVINVISMFPSNLQSTSSNPLGTVKYESMHRSTNCCFSVISRWPLPSSISRSMTDTVHSSDSVSSTQFPYLNRFESCVPWFW